MTENRSGRNFMFSALSVIIAFAQLTLNAFGKSLEQLLRLQNLTKEEIRVAYPVFLNNIKEQQEVIFTVANKIYGSKVNEFTKSYIKQGTKVFGSSAENIDFNKNVEAAATINEWASNNTGGLIKDLVSSGMFNGDTRLVILNALYFLGKWVHQFKEENTKPRDFYLNDNDTIPLPTMNQQNTFPYAESDQLDCQILRLPYKGNFSLVIYLSREKTGLKNLVSKLAEPNAFLDSLELLKNQKVNVSLPKMDFETVFDDLKIYLIKYNITTIFSPSNDFKDIFVKDELLWVSDAIQKSYFIVDEKGTEAAAVTGIVARTLAVQAPTKVFNFELNHPAPFVLLMGKNPVFCGVFSGAK